jgi:hypothetical protein
MDVKPFTLVLEVLVPEGKIKEVESWHENISIEDYIESVVKDHVNDRGMLCKLAVVEGDLYKDVKEYAHELANHKAVVALEQEILDSKMCIGGSCED